MPSKPTPLIVPLSAQAQARQWVRERIAGESEFHIPAIVDEMVERFGNDTGWLKLFLDEMFRPMAYRLVVDTVAKTRPGDLLGDDVVTAETRKDKARRMSSRWNNWLEHCGGRHVRLMDMTKTDLLAAADERQARGDIEHELAALWRALAERLENGERVADRFKPEEIDTVQLSLTQREKVA